MLRKVFISYHHKNDQYYKDFLIKLNKSQNNFIDMSVAIGDISDDLSDQEIRRIIRDDYLKDTEVLILLLGLETKNRKHIDWEIFSSMYDGKINKKAGILVINLPTLNNKCCIRSGFADEKEKVFNYVKEWTSINNREELERRHPYMPARLIDNFLENNVTISVVDFNQIQEADNLKLFIENAFKSRLTNSYNLSRPMRRNNS